MSFESVKMSLWGLTHYNFLYSWSFFLVLVLCAGCMAKEVSKKYNLISGVLFFWVLFSGLRVVSFSLSPYANESVEWRQAFDRQAYESMACFLLLLAPLFTLKMKTWARFFRWVAFVNVGVTLFLTAIDFHHWVNVLPFGILSQASMSGCFMVSLLPLFATRWETLVAGIAAIFLADQSLPLGCFFFTVGVLCLRQKRYWALLGAFTASLVLGYLFQGSLLFNSSGRTTIWMDSIRTWNELSNRALGFGSGSFWLLGPMISKLPKPHVFTFLHSDWLQIGFEQGLVGLVLALSFYAYLIKRAWNRSPLLFALVGYGAWGVANMPLRYPLAALYGAFLIRWTFDRDSYQPVFRLK